MVSLDTFLTASHPPGEGVFMPNWQVGEMRAECQPLGALVQNQVLCFSSGSPPRTQGLSEVCFCLTS